MHPGRHSLFAYDDDEALAVRMGAFLRDGLEAGDEVLTVLPQHKWALLQETLGPPAARVANTDRDGFYTRPEAALARCDARVRRLLRDGATSIRVFGELPLCRTQEESDRWITCEALLNEAFAHHPLWMVCGVDTRAQRESVIEGSWRTHPDVLDGSCKRRHHFDDPADTVRALAPEPKPVAGLRTVEIPQTPRELRARLAGELATAEVPREAAESLLAAAGEVLGNARRHGGGARLMRCGRVDGRFAWELYDNGPGIDDPLAGYLPPRPGQDSGAGLWVVRQLTERVELLRSACGFALRLWV